MLRLNLLLRVRNFFNAENLPARKIQLNGELSQDVSGSLFFRNVHAEKILNCETINSESMCILIKAKWRRNLDKATRNLFYHFQALF